jgi:hypothetical protein
MGCLAEGCQVMTSRVSINSKFAIPNGAGKISSVYFIGFDEKRWDNRAASLLFTRGWTLQEEALAPRFLSFQPRQASLRLGHESIMRADIPKISRARVTQMQRK